MSYQNNKNKLLFTTTPVLHIINWIFFFYFGDRYGIKLSNIKYFLFFKG